MCRFILSVLCIRVETIHFKPKCKSPPPTWPVLRRSAQHLLTGGGADVLWQCGEISSSNKETSASDLLSETQFRIHTYIEFNSNWSESGWLERAYCCWTSGWWIDKHRNPNRSRDHLACWANYKNSYILKASVLGIHPDSAQYFEFYAKRLAPRFTHLFKPGNLFQQTFLLLECMDKLREGINNVYTESVCKGGVTSLS